MERIVDATETEEVLAAAIAILRLPRSIERIDALVSYPGMLEHTRVIEAIHWWQEEQTAARFLIVAGQSRAENAIDRLDMRRLIEPPFGLTQMRGVKLQAEAAHTKDQTEWVAERVQELGVKSLALFTSPYHLPRLYLTQLKSLLVRGIQIPIIPSPSICGLDSYSPAAGVAMWKLVAGDTRRILGYQKKGDLASLEELQDYLAWLHQ